MDKRPLFLETAYVMEDLLYSVEHGLRGLPPANYFMERKQPIVNRVVGDRLRREVEERERERAEREKLVVRKRMLREQLERMKGDRERQ